MGSSMAVSYLLLIGGDSAFTRHIAEVWTPGMLVTFLQQLVL